MFPSPQNFTVIRFLNGTPSRLFTIIPPTKITPMENSTEALVEKGKGPFGLAMAFRVLVRNIIKFKKTFLLLEQTKFYHKRLLFIFLMAKLNP